MQGKLPEQSWPLKHGISHCNAASNKMICGTDTQEKPCQGGGFEISTLFPNKRIQRFGSIAVFKKLEMCHPYDKSVKLYSGGGGWGRERHIP